jgi:hypothetical protein
MSVTNWVVAVYKIELFYLLAVLNYGSTLVSKDNRRVR